MGLHETIHGAETSGERSGMLMGEYLARAERRLLALVELHRLSVPDWALVSLADLVLPIVLENARLRGLVTDDEAEWLALLRGTEPPWFVRWALRRWSRGGTS